MKDLREKLGIPADFPLFVVTRDHGDGRRRYRFFTVPAEGYHASNGIATVLGRREALAFVRGYLTANKTQHPTVSNGDEQ